MAKIKCIPPIKCQHCNHNEATSVLRGQSDLTITCKRCDKKSVLPFTYKELPDAVIQTPPEEAKRRRQQPDYDQVPSRWKTKMDIGRSLGEKQFERRLGIAQTSDPSDDRSTRGRKRRQREEECD